jgi:hypothetical protein
MESELKCPPKFKTDGPIVRALFERALAGPPKKVVRAPKKGTPVAEVKKG